MLMWAYLDFKQECGKEQVGSDGSPTPKGLDAQPEGQLPLAGELVSIV